MTWVIRNTLNLYWTGNNHGCDVWKSRFTCGGCFNSKSYAEEQIKLYNLKDCEVVYIDYRE
ncbi:hypothetical protein [Vibrio phage JSF13]|jgi:hypothetical protein|uniref:Uncharacterized protein ORF65 n=1 Tax=Vibrio phage ICP1 TaxID=979525 RepID=F1D187_9CAUD|nr:hypothetical protein ViPhICP1_gp065 [Vibrio phage ICP1]ADX88108.1 hypothetical protein TUST1-191_00310 [Vibrio phage ICP1_2006_D]ADX88335.1 hypothetical protein TUST1-182_00310 [Vibrio phage ICP1_2006_C]ADX88562.1 hypothetical protein TUST1-159_00310 [Vibrio phage ICP1_2006_B]ADX88788.1 hypothetical protein TUST1-17_00310 [Vibrio phage ICP1_2006_A]ADX89014.1 hypothetical protein TUST1-15_00310 [Vibrio phage ICP1_2005_A]ADX89246.1 hypothetical protein TUST1-2_00320 [Vibrio phage ICP1_2001_A